MHYLGGVQNMMLKLMKYEIKSTYKVFFTIMASFVLLTHCYV